MDMGSANCENSTVTVPETLASGKAPGSTLVAKKPHFNRPKFFPCLQCGRKFTIRALAVHKQTCTEKADCCCSACKGLAENAQQESLTVTSSSNIQVQEPPATSSEESIPQHQQKQQQSMHPTVPAVNIQLQLPATSVGNVRMHPPVTSSSCIRVVTPITASSNIRVVRPMVSSNSVRLMPPAISSSICRQRPPVVIRQQPQPPVVVRQQQPQVIIQQQQQPLVIQQQQQQQQPAVIQQQQQQHPVVIQQQPVAIQQQQQVIIQRQQEQHLVIQHQPPTSSTNKITKVALPRTCNIVRLARRGGIANLAKAATTVSATSQPSLEANQIPTLTTDRKSCPTAENDPSVVQVSIVLQQPCPTPMDTSSSNNDPTTETTQSTTAGATAVPQTNFLVINQENEQCISNDISNTNGLLLLHEAGLLSMAGVKLEPLQDTSSNQECVQKGVAQQIMFSLPNFGSKGKGSGRSRSSKRDCTIVNSSNVSPYSNRRLVCVVCKVELPWEVFGSHVVQHSVVPDGQQLQCPKCFKSFNRSAMLLIHFYKHITNKSFVCKDCQSSFQFCDDLKSHTLNEHGYMEVQPFHCYICMRRFSHPQTIINHMRIHAKETPFKCNECNRSFSQIGNLQRHMSVHRGDRPHKCQECDRSFADPATLRNHVRIHTGETPFVCKVCMRGFTQIGNLKRHMARHLQAPSKNAIRSTRIGGQKPSFMISDENNSEEFQCENNSYFPFEEKIESAIMDNENMESTAEVQNLEDKQSVMLVDVKKEALSKETTMAISQLKEQRRKQHWQLFPCPVCGKIYTWQHDLSIHFRIHTGEKPYNCDLCGKQFAQSGAVRTHKARHHNIVSSS